MASRPYFRSEHVVTWNGKDCCGIESLWNCVDRTTFTLLKAEMEYKAKKGGYERFRIYLLAEQCAPDPDTPLEGRCYYAMLRRRPKADASWISCAYCMPTDAATLGEAIWESFRDCNANNPDNDVAFGGFYGLEEGGDEKTLRIYVMDTQASLDMFRRWCKARIARTN